MTELNILRQRLKAATAALEALLAEREQFAKGRWLSRTALQRLGYAVRDGETSDIELSFRTPHGRESYAAYHAGQVELRERTWRKLVAGCPTIPASLSRTRRSDRNGLRAALAECGQHDLAECLRPSLVTPHQFAIDRDRLARLGREIEDAEGVVAAAKEAYDEVWLPVLKRRRLTVRRRELTEELRALGVSEEALGPDLSVEDLELLLAAKRTEARRQANLAELARLGVDPTTVPADISPEALGRLVERRRRQADPVRVGRKLRMHGIDPDHVSAAVDPQRVLDLLEVDGHLGLVSANLSSDGRIAELRSANNLLAAWACERYPSYVTEEECDGGPDRVRLVFRRPPRPARPRSRGLRRARRRAVPERLAERLRWQQVGF